MGQALYRTYRSKNLAEIVGQEHVTKALGQALKKGTISHAYLFTGPRGVGKTSIARILAHEINELPYAEDRQHLDIIEIDAASNRRIDEIRDLRDKVHVAPASAKYKVYIIDEVHMLTKEAFNALLKTLEEPPAHVVFILATTEAHKLPETIVSRTQRYTFKPVDSQQVIDHLRHIAKSEAISIDDEALRLIAAHGDGSFRDSISLLDQARNSASDIGLAEVQNLLGVAPDELIQTLQESIQSHDSVSLAKALKAMHDQGYEPTQIAKQVGQRLRNAVLENSSGLPPDVALKLMTMLVQVPASPDPRAALEIALLDAVLSEETLSTPLKGVMPKSNTPPQKISSHSEQKTMPEEVKAAPAIQETPTREKAASPKKTEIIADIDTTLTLTDEAWELVLGAVKKKHSTIFSMLNSAKPHFEPGKITLEFSYGFHQKRLNDVRNKQTISNVIQGVTGSDIQLVCIVGEGKPRSAPKTPLPPVEGEIVHNAAPIPATHATSQSVHSEKPTQSSPISTISDIFGGAEVLES